MHLRPRGPLMASLTSLTLLVALFPMSALAVVQGQGGPNSQPVAVRLNLQVTATPEGSVVAWQAVPGANRYVVHRWKRLGNQPRCCEVRVPAGTALRYRDAALPGAGTYLYRVVAHLQGGGRGYEERILEIAAPTVAATAPVGGPGGAGLVNPRDFVATQTGDGIVSLTWTRPAGASFYRLTGPGVRVDGARLTATRYTASGVPGGRQEWQLVAYYAPGAVGNPQNPSRAVLVVQGQQAPSGVAVAPGSPVTDAAGTSPPLATIDNPNRPGDILQRMPPGGAPAPAPPTDSPTPEAGSSPPGATIENPDRPRDFAQRQPPTSPAPGAGDPSAPTGGAPVVAPPRRDGRISVPLQPDSPAGSEPAGSASQPAAMGRYLVTVTGLQAGSVTTDNMFHEDGRGDEVFAAAVVRRYDRRTAEVLETTRRQTTVYGDVNGRGNERVQAGRLSSMGGIGNGDPIPGDAPTARTLPAQETVFPWKLWAGTLTEGADALVISPSIWEYDGRPALFDAWVANQSSLTSTLFFSQRLQDQIDLKAFGPLALGASEASHPYWLTQARVNAPAFIAVAFGLPPILNLEGEDRPIGLVGGPALPNTTVVLTREIIEAALAGPPLGAMIPTQGVVIHMPKPGMIVINFEDTWRRSITDRVAFYSMVLQVERVP